MPYEQNPYCSKHSIREPGTLDGYRQFGGYQAWEKILRERSRARKSSMSQGFGPAGRGGAAFPDRPEVEFHASHIAGQKYAVCNSPDESERATCHDRDILRYTRTQ